ncbi:MAG: GNAT family N-acetyltransferase [Adhaeribacter sp.]
MSPSEVKFLEWDSSFFGYPVGEYNYAGNETDLLNTLHYAQYIGFKLIYLKSLTEISLPSTLNHSYQIGVVDNKIIFQKNLVSNPAALPAKNIIHYTKLVVSSELTQLALESGRYSRFARDQNFKQQEYKKLYTTWIKNSITGEMANEVWVSTTPTGAITGMITIGRKNNEAFIGLLAVVPAFQRQGYGKKLVQTACERALTWGCTTIQVGTQGINLPANSIYLDAGFSLHDQHYIYHLWI